VSGTNGQSGIWDIPPSWIWTTTGDVADVIGGGTPRTGEPENFADGEVPWVTPADLSGYTQKLIEKGARNITQRGLASSGARLMPKGTVLFSSRAPIGYVAIAANPISTNQGFKSFVLPDGILPDYVYYYLRAAKDVAVALASGTTFLEISGAKAKRIPFPLAPSDEQSRIVAEIEKQFTRLDAAVAALKRVQANLKRYRAAVLKAACEGRLVPTEAELARKEGRSYETGEQLLARILKERRAKWEAEQIAKMRVAGGPTKDDDWKKKYKEPGRLATSGLPPLPKGWTWATLGQLSSVITSGSRGWAEYYAAEGPVFIRAQDIKTDRLALGEVAHVKVPEGAEGERTRVYPKDLLITITGANVTKTAIALVGSSEAYVSQHVGLVRPVVSDLSAYLYFWIVSPAHGRKILEKAAYGAGKPGLNLDNLRELPVALPPVEEQVRVVDAIASQISTIEDADIALRHGIRRADRLRQSILKRAFEGKLVPQDPNDESASMLLEHIRAKGRIGTAESTAQRIQGPVRHRRAFSGNTSKERS
jgi:type I restriction enzyme S subunit